MKKQNQIPFIIAVIIIHVSSISLHAQDTLITDSRGTPVPRSLLNRISIELNGIPLLDALSRIAEEGKFHLNYSESILPVQKRVSVRLKEVPVVDALKKILEQTDIDFLVTQGGQIVLVRSTSLKSVKPAKKCTVSGYVKDGATGEALIGTNIYIDKLQTGCTSNMYGFYSMTIPSDDYTIKYSYIGYEPEEIQLNLFESIKRDVELKETTISGETVVITAEIEDKNVKSTEMGTIQLIPKKLSSIPILFGEQDLFKTIQLLPGITQSRDGDCGIYVRGGNSDQNLILLDEAQVYNAFHFFGFFSVFNSDAIKDVKLIKGSAPPKYGGKLS